MSREARRFTGPQPHSLPINSSSPRCAEVSSSVVSSAEGTSYGWRVEERDEMRRSPTSYTGSSRGKKRSTTLKNNQEASSPFKEPPGHLYQQEGPQQHYLGKCSRQRRQGRQISKQQLQQNSTFSHNSVCVEVRRKRRCPFITHHRSCVLAVSLSIACFIVALHVVILYDPFPGSAGVSFITSSPFLSADRLAALDPIFSLLRTQLPLTFSFQKLSHLENNVSPPAAPSPSFSAACSAVDAANAAAPFAATAALESTVSATEPSSKRPTQESAETSRVSAPGGSAHFRVAAADGSARNTGGAVARRRDAVVVEQKRRPSSDSTSFDIEFYSYRRGKSLTLVHDAAAEGPAAAPAGHRVAARLPPFTQALIASPFQRPPPPSTVGGAEGKEEAAVKGTGRWRGGGGETPFLAEVGGAEAIHFSSSPSVGQVNVSATSVEDCFSRSGGGSLLLETSGLYRQSYIREFDFCTGETLRQLYLHPGLFAEGAAFLWEPEQQELLLLVLTWREGLLLVLHAETWEFLGTLQISFEGWGLASSLSTADAAAAVAWVKQQRRAAADASAADAEADAGNAAVASATLTYADSEIWVMKKRERVEAIQLPPPLHQRLQQQRLWATTGQDVLLELDVPQLLASIRQLPSYSAAAAAAVDGNSRGLSSSSSSARVNDDESAAPAECARAEAGAAATEESHAAAARGGEGDTAGKGGKKEEAAAAFRWSVVGSRGKKSRGLVSSTPFLDAEAAWGAATALAADVQAAAAPAAAGPKATARVRVLKRLALRCLGVPLALLNELEYVPERNSLLANVFGSFHIAEVDINTGVCKSLASFGGLDGSPSVRQRLPVERQAALLCSLQDGC